MSKLQDSFHQPDDRASTFLLARNKIAKSERLIAEKYYVLQAAGRSQKDMTESEQYRVKSNTRIRIMN